MAFINTPDGTAAAGICDAPASEGGELHHLCSGAPCAACACGLSRCTNIPVGIGDCALPVPPHQTADIAVAGYIACAVGIADDGIDIARDGEIVIGNNEWLMVVACSAGPCFEGSGIRHGMRATPGAIESVKIDPQTYEPDISVIGNSHPTGICGSGMIDAISEMFLTGIIDQKGKFVLGKTGRIREGDEGLEFVFYKDEKYFKDVVLTEADIENILRAKAAVYAGVMTLLNEVGFTMDEVAKIYIAGGFGNCINIERAITLGMLPDISKDRFVFMGNTSITGAYLCLLSEELRKEAEEVASKMTYVELSVSRNFMDEYMSALFLPHTDMRQFPTVAGLIKDGKTYL